MPSPLIVWGRVNLYTAPGYPFSFAIPVLASGAAAAASDPAPCSGPLGDASGVSAADAEHT